MLCAPFRRTIWFWEFKIRIVSFRLSHLSVLICVLADETVAHFRLNGNHVNVINAAQFSKIGRHSLAKQSFCQCTSWKKNHNGSYRIFALNYGEWNARREKYPTSLAPEIHEMRRLFIDYETETKTRKSQNKRTRVYIEADSRSRFCVILRNCVAFYRIYKDICYLTVEYSSLCLFEVASNVVCVCLIWCCCLYVSFFVAAMHAAI